MKFATRILLLAACWAGVLGTPDAAHAQTRGALRLPGLGYAQADDHDSLDVADQSVTLEAWFRHDGTSDEDAVIVTKNAGSSLNYELSLIGEGDDLPVRFCIYSLSFCAVSEAGIPAGEWTHVAGTYNNGTLTVYVNGEQAGIRNTSGNMDANESPLTIGAASDGTRILHGQVDEVRLWADARTALEIRGGVYGPLAPGAADLLAYYPFSNQGDDQAGTKNLSLQGNASFVTPGVFPIAPRLFAAPGNASATLTIAERLGLSNANLASQIKVYRSTQMSGADRTLVGTLGAGATTFTDAGLTNGTTYYYTATAVNALGEESDFSYTASVTPYATRGGGALALGGEGYAQATGNPGFDIADQTVTLEAWIRHDGTSDEDAVIVTKNAGSSLNYELSLLGLGEDVPVQFCIYSLSFCAVSTVPVSANEWTHVAGTYNNGNLAVYVNGEQAGTRGTSGNMDANESPLTIGATSEATRLFSGRIDEVRLWDRALPANEIEDAFLQGPVGNEEDLIVSIRFDEVGSTAPRSSETGPLTLQLQGDAAVVAGGILPLAPQVFARLNPSNGGVTLALAERQAGAAQHRIYRSTQANGSDATPVATLGAGSTGFTDAGLTEGTVYFYWATALNAAGQESDFSRPITVTGSAGRNPYALSVSGDGYAQVGSGPGLNMADQTVTLEAWIRHDGTSEEDAVIVTKNSGSSLNYELSLVGEGEEVPVQFCIYSLSFCAASTATVPANEWTHVAGTYNNGNLIVFINGEQAGTRGTSGNMDDNDSPLTVGATSEGTRRFSGLIDDVRLWDDVRTSIEIRQNFRTLLTGNEEDLILNLRFDEPSGLVARSSGPITYTAQLLGDAEFAVAEGTPLPNETPVALPEAFELDGNFPNPVRARTTIRFALPAASAVRLAVFDVTGRQVAVVLNGETQPAGWHNVAFDAASLPSGVYFYRLTAGDASATGRMTVVQ